MAKTFVTNAGALATRKRVLAGKSEERYRVVAQSHGAKMKWVAQSLSSGPLSSAALRKMGHPYAVHFLPGQAGMPDYIINVQSGQFRAAWKVRIQKTARGWTITLYNPSPHARFMQGTARMRVRAILEEVQRRTAPQLSREARKVVRAALQENATLASLSTGGALLYAVSVGVTSAVGAVESAM